MMGVFGRINWRQMVLLIAAVAVMQGLYWLVISRQLFDARPRTELNAIQIDRMELARLPQPTLAALAHAQFKPSNEPAFTYCCDRAAFAARMHFTLDKVPQRGVGVVSTLQVDNYLLLANGSVLVAEGSMRPGQQTFHGQKTFLTRIPAGVLRAGDNDLTYVTLRDGFPYTDIFPPILAEHDALRNYAAHRLWVMGTYPLYSGLLLAVLGIFAAIMVARSAERGFALWLSLLCSVFAANSLYLAALAPPFGAWTRMMVYFAINMALPAVLLCFVDSWTGRAWRGLQWASMLVWVLGCAGVAYCLFGTAMPGAFDNAATIWSWLLIGLAITSAARLLWHFARHAEDRYVQIAILSVCVAAVGIDAIGKLYPESGMGEGNLFNAAPFLMLAMVVAFLARNIRLFQSQSALNAMLAAKVEQREQQLAAAHRRERLLVRKQAHDDERRRIMRDLHDGLGSQLMSMLLAARVGIAEPEQVADGLQSVVDEMRLMVDSMDSVGESLGSALLIFRQRVQPRVESAGLAFGWDQQADADLAGYGPRDVLQVFRVMQEAVTNALKHAGASRIDVHIRPVGAGAGAGVAIAIVDDGRGFSAAMDAVAGRGLTNMRSRAAAVDGELTVQPGTGGGTTVTLLLHSRAAATLGDGDDGDAGDGSDAGHAAPSAPSS
ncbi:MAG: sensor histidine kinase [Sphingopyxis sp.]